MRLATFAGSAGARLGAGVGRGDRRSCVLASGDANFPSTMLALLERGRKRPCDGRTRPGARLEGAAGGGSARAEERAPAGAGAEARQDHRRRSQLQGPRGGGRPAEAGHSAACSSRCPHRWLARTAPSPFRLASRSSISRWSWPSSSASARAGWRRAMRSATWPATPFSMTFPHANSSSM